MAEMGDPTAAQRVIHYCNTMTLFGGQIRISFSKQPSIAYNVDTPFVLSDGTASFKDYTGSSLNRYLTPSKALKNQIYWPTDKLHFFNFPKGIETDKVLQHFEQLFPHIKPVKVNHFKLKGKNCFSLSQIIFCTYVIIF